MPWKVQQNIYTYIYIYIAILKIWKSAQKYNSNVTPKNIQQNLHKTEGTIYIVANTKNKLI